MTNDLISRSKLLARFACWCGGECGSCEYHTHTGDCRLIIEAPAVPITGDTSDGYHTFNDLISREAALIAMPKDDELYSLDVRRVILNVPAVEAAPVVHAHYGFKGPHIGETYSPYAGHGTCSNCKSRILIDPQHDNFCPECGAKMDKEE